MTLRCLSVLSRSTTKGKEYKVFKETDNFYIIIEDDYHMCNIAKCFVPKFFEVVK